MNDNAIAFARMIVDEDIQQQEANRTIMVDRRDYTEERLLLPSEMKQERRRHKSVRFPLKLKELVTVRYIPRTTQDEHRDLWYSTAELDRIQDHDDANCLYAMSHEGCSAFLDNAFLATDGIEKQQSSLKCWCRYANNLRGFETTVNREHSVERFVQKSVNIQSVLLAQETARDKLTEANMSDMIARISERCSRRARELAIALGAADEYAEMCREQYYRETI